LRRPPRCSDCDQERGEFTYIYNAASGPIPEAADNNNLSIQSGVPGLSNTVANTPQDIIWHFKVEPGLVYRQ